LTEGYEHHPEDHGDPAPGLIWFTGLLGALLLVVIMLGLTALYYNVKAEVFQRQVVSAERLELQELYAPQRALLAGPPRFIERDEQGQTVTAYIIPIERAMQLVIDEANAGGGR
jgi:hypothetical protein